MFALVLSETSAIAIEDEGLEDWTFHFFDVAPLSVDSFTTGNGGTVVSATVNPETHAVWLIAGGQLYAASRQRRIAMRLPFPGKGSVPFDVNLIGSRFYVCCDAGTIWYYEREREEWVNLLRPDPRPPMPPREDDETAATYTARTSPAQYEYARKFPDFYRSFAIGDATYFIGALGRVVVLRGRAMEEHWIDSGIRLIRGHAEGSDAVIAGDDPLAEIYKGTAETGFEVLFSDEVQALHLTAQFDGQRYIAAARDPHYDSVNLFTLEGDELVPVETGCEREPGMLLELTVRGNALWAVDDEGFFRLSGGKWQLFELTDIRSAGTQTEP